MMTKLKKAVQKLVDQELAMACNDHGDRFNSAHEAFAVIREEQEEVGMEMHALNEQMSDFWINVKCDSDHISNLCRIEENAINLACEAVQVAAMAMKAQRGYEVDDERTAVHQR